MSRSYDQAHPNQDPYGVTKRDWFDELCDDLDAKVAAGEITKEERDDRLKASWSPKND
ncbi:MAG: hypothetical protein ACRYG8_23485 [Janthinobacterium lividum]